jgi:L-alanine-DL-glutamate epimerase-like enolase superfamily enzyme
LVLETDVERDGKAVVGYGFNSNGRYAQSGLLRERFLRRILAADPDSLVDQSGANLDPERVWQVAMTNEKPGGHGERSVAVGIIDMALWDLVGKIAERPLREILAERYGDGTWDGDVAVYAAGGYYQESGVSALEEEIRGYLDLGDRDVVQMDPVLSYGIVEYVRMLEELRRHGWSRRRAIPHGGHQLALHVASGLKLGGSESYPGVFEPFGRFADDIPIVEGRVGLPSVPGVGFETNARLFAVLRSAHSETHLLRERRLAGLAG